MTTDNIVDVSISLDVTTVSEEGFGTIAFASEHMWFSGRTKSFTQLSDADGIIPADSPEYAALTQAFSVDVRPSVVKLARREVDTMTLTPNTSSSAQTFSFTIEDTDGNIVPIAHQSDANDDADTIATDIKAEIDANSITSSLTAVVTSGQLIITKVADCAVYGLPDILPATFTTTETATNMLANVTAYDDDFYFIASSDHSETFVLALAAACEAAKKIYFVSLADVDCLAAYTTSSTDTMAQLFHNGYNYTTAWYHNDADTIFPEMNYAAIAAPADPGKKIWANNRVTGSTVSRHPTTGNVLSSDEKAALVARNANWVDYQGGVAVTRKGTTSGNASYIISLVRNRDFLTARVTEAYQNLLITRPVIPATNAGIGSIENVFTSTMDRYVETEKQPNILQEDNPYTVNFPRRSEMSFADIAAGIFTGSFEAYLSGAFRSIKISGSLTYQSDS